MSILRKTLWASVGLFGLATLIAMPATADQVILDDLIVDGSACIGFDCVNGESFGFDTIRIKENNLRIRAFDTSSAASFPTNDWQITFNDSANGGAEKFSIDDITGGRTPFTIEASAPSHSLYVDDGGRLGLGTATPVVEVHIKDGDTPTLRLEQDGSSGFAPQTWDVAGNETNFFIRDVSNGSTLPLRIRPGAPTSALDIANDGDIAMGATSPGGSSVLIQRAGAAVVSVVSSDATNAQLNFGSAADADPFQAGRILYTHSTGKFEYRAETEYEWDVGGTTRMTLTAAGLVTDTGGSCDPGPCDGTFEPDYEVESIDDHADFMWENKHLWGVGPTPDDGPINLTKTTTGMLHELEKAHIYIEQLHERLERLEEKLTTEAQ